MDSNEFAYWLNGFFEMANPKSLDEKQTRMVREHLSLLFTKVTPTRLDDKLVAAARAMAQTGETKFC